MSGADDGGGCANRDDVLRAYGREQLGRAELERKSVAVLQSEMEDKDNQIQTSDFGIKK